MSCLIIQKNKSGFTPPETVVPKRKSFLAGFTLVEVMVAFSIFAVIMSLLLSVMMMDFRSLRQGEKMLNREQRQRFCLDRLNREVSSLTKIESPGASLVGAEDGFFLSTPGKIIWWSPGIFIIPKPLL